MGMEAAVAGDEKLLKQAMTLDPLVGAVCTPPEVWQMADEMLVATEEWLPQYGDVIAGAKERLADPDNLLPTNAGYEGAARLKVKTVEELAVDKESARENSAKADKG